MNSEDSILGLDIGDRRIGVAIATLAARLPKPLTTLNNDSQIWANLMELISKHSVSSIVAGLPKNMSGQDTAQTVTVREFIDKLKKSVDIPVYLTDEAVTSIMAEQELVARGKQYAKADIDALAATIILGDYLQSLTETAR